MSKVTIDISDFWSLDDKTAIYQMVERLSTLVGFTAIKVVSGSAKVPSTADSFEPCLDYKIVLNFGDNTPVDVPEMEFVIRFTQSGKVCSFNGKLTKENSNLTYNDMPKDLMVILDLRGLLFTPFVHRSMILKKVGEVWQQMIDGVGELKKNVDKEKRD